MGNAILRQLRTRGPLSLAEIDTVASNYGSGGRAGATICNELGDRVVLRSCPGGVQWVLAEEDAIEQAIAEANGAGVPLASFSQSQRLLIRQEIIRLPLCLDGAVVKAQLVQTVRKALEAAAPRGCCAYTLSGLYAGANAELQSALASGHAFAVGSTVWAAPSHGFSAVAREQWMSLSAKPGAQRAGCAVEHKPGQVIDGGGQRAGRRGPAHN